MEGLYKLPPWAQARVIDYGISVESRSRLPQRAVQHPKIAGRLDRRRSSWACCFILLPLIDHPIAKCWDDREPQRAEPRRRTPEPSHTEPGRRQFFAPIPQFNLRFAATPARDSALGGITYASSSASISKGIQAHLPAIPL